MLGLNGWMRDADDLKYKPSAIALTSVLGKRWPTTVL